MELVAVHRGGAERPRTTVADEPVERLHRLGHGSRVVEAVDDVEVEAVDDVEVEVVDAEARQGPLDLPLDRPLDRCPSLK